MTTPITITPVFVADLLAEGERMPLYVHVIDHPDARVLVDTGMTELHPAGADLDPRLRPLSEQDFDLAGIDIVVNTHLHFDHCGGNHLFAGKPFYVQRQELDEHFPHRHVGDRPSELLVEPSPGRGGIATHRELVERRFLRVGRSRATALHDRALKERAQRPMRAMQVAVIQRLIIRQRLGQQRVRTGGISCR